MSRELAALLGLVVVTALAGCSSTPPDRSWRPTFPSDDGLITNEVGVHKSPDWQVTSGSLFAASGTGSTGAIDGGAPDASSSRATGSAVFRAVSQRSDFQDVEVSMEINIGPMTSTPRTPEQDYDGVHVFLRYQSAASLYTVDLCRRDDTVTIKRKVARSGAPDGGDYTTLISAPYPCKHGIWNRFTATVRNQSSGVSLSLRDASGSVVSVVDKSSALRSAGRVGLRGDNTPFQFRSFVAAPSEES
ncbi:hypothetical protein [Cryptosporangium sp. NPDC048952]|uniref:hypothetical protein n=1 Tax=Cryptosporangium sp. NPDC048952 TaxID=3363961 RepID=UPI00371FF04B